MRTFYLVLLSITCIQYAHAQFPPQAGTAGTTAIHMDSSVFIAWAKSCTLNLGWQNIADTSLGKAKVGDATYVPGKAGNGVVSLGDGGIATIEFEHPIINGNGFDFAVFENGFKDQTLAPGTAFLELAFVEVSSDGIHFTRFPSTSLNDTTTQLQSFEGMFAEKINNLAGKYIGNYGTPFDLDELKDIEGLNINGITHVRIIDVVGSLNDSFVTRDAQQHKVNDPWPTPFASSGFDLDAVGVIHQDITQSVAELLSNTTLNIYPNPAQLNHTVLLEDVPNSNLTVYDALGNEFYQYRKTTDGSNLQLLFQHSGMYYVVVRTGDTVMSKRLIIQ